MKIRIETAKAIRDVIQGTSYSGPPIYREAADRAVALLNQEIEAAESDEQEPPIEIAPGKPLNINLDEEDPDFAHDLWLVTWTHRHGYDTWLFRGQPSMGEVIALLESQGYSGDHDLTTDNLEIHQPILVNSSRVVDAKSRQEGRCRPDEKGSSGGEGRVTLQPGSGNVGCDPSAQTLEEIESQLAGKSKEFEEVRIERDNLRAEVAKLRTKVISLETELGRAHLRSRGRVAEIRDLKAEVSRLKDYLEDRNRHIATLKKSNDSRPVITPTFRNTLSEAEVCKMNGWEVGTLLAGNEGYGWTIIEITAVGLRDILARTRFYSKVEVKDGPEVTWMLAMREWYQVRPGKMDELVTFIQGEKNRSVQLHMISEYLMPYERRITPLPAVSPDC